MGAAAIVAGARRHARARAGTRSLLAALATLALNPRASADVGWQLSFAAVVGILLWAAPLRDALLARSRRAAGARRRASRARALAEGAALTIAATLATAPLMAHHFETLSLAALPANLLALPAVAPVMWLGMLAAMAGQVPAIPVEPLNAVNALLIAYIAWVAHVLGAGARPSATFSVNLLWCWGNLDCGHRADRSPHTRFIVCYHPSRHPAPGPAAYAAAGCRDGRQ